MCVSDPVQYIYDCNRDTDMADECHFLQHVLVFVKVEEPNIDKFRLEILCSLGGKVHVQCNCSNFPLVPKINCAIRSNGATDVTGSNILCATIVIVLLDCVRLAMIRIQRTRFQC